MVVGRRTTTFFESPKSEARRRVGDITFCSHDLSKTFVSERWVVAFTRCCHQDSNLNFEANLRTRKYAITYEICHNSFGLQVVVVTVKLFLLSSCVETSFRAFIKIWRAFGMEYHITIALQTFQKQQTCQKAAIRLLIVNDVVATIAVSFGIMFYTMRIEVDLSGIKPKVSSRTNCCSHRKTKR
jgi:hypothetical protein